MKTLLINIVLATLLLDLISSEHAVGPSGAWQSQNRKHRIENPVARVAELADAPDLGSGGEIRRGSSPLPGTL